MTGLIEEIIEKFGGRIAGSKEEREAQLLLKSKLEKYCDEVSVHEFSDALTAKFHSLKWICGIQFLAIILFPVAPVWATLFSLIASTLFVGQFLLNLGWLDRFYPQKASLNVEGTIEPEGEARRTIIVSGHMDSVWEFQWWYTLKRFGGALTSIAGFHFFLTPIYYLFILAMFYLFNEGGTWMLWGWGVLAFLSLSLFAFFFIHGPTKVDGAIDNLTGVAVAHRLGEYFSANKLQHTRIKVVSFGSEETGLKGSQNYVKDHLTRLTQEDTLLLNVDTIRSDEHIAVVDKEMTSRVAYSKGWNEKILASFEATELPPKRTHLPIGGTDAAPFAKNGIGAVSIIGLNTKALDPTYHTRMDCLDNLQPEGIEKLSKALIYFIIEEDQKG